MTERLYLEDPYLLEFEASAVSMRDRAGAPAVVLDRTAFYPEGGGQPSDTGSLGGIPVVEVVEEGGEILHVLAGPPPPGRLSGRVDARRRRDHVQQHHGQHLLSAAFDRLHGASTLSFHLGEETCTIDLDAPHGRLGPDQLREAEAAANDMVWRDLPVEARVRTPEELALLPLRKDAVKGARIVTVLAPAAGGGVEVLDASPCGGTHPRRTGEVGGVAVMRAQKWGSGTRVEFACGGRILALLHAVDERGALAASHLRCAPAELAVAAERHALEAQARRKELEGALASLAEAVAARIALPVAEGAPVVARLQPPLSGPSGLRLVAHALASAGRTAILGGLEGDRGAICLARPRGDGPDLGSVLREAVALLGGKGGGGRDMAQGGGPRGEALDEALELARTRLATAG